MMTKIGQTDMKSLDKMVNGGIWSLHILSHHSGATFRSYLIKQEKNAKLGKTMFKVS
jgi:hypothetical protein